MPGFDSKRGYYMELLKEKASVLGRKPTYTEVEYDTQMPHPNDYAFYCGSFSDAVEEAWRAVRIIKKDGGNQGQSSESKVDRESFNRMLECALEVCEKLQQVPRELEVWKKALKHDFVLLNRTLGGGDFFRTLRVVQDAWDERHPELKGENDELLSFEDLDWGKEEWLRWLDELQCEGNLWVFVKKHHNMQYKRILAIFGTWAVVESGLKERRRSIVKTEVDEMNEEREKVVQKPEEVAQESKMAAEKCTVEPKERHKKRVYMSKEEMRKFVLSAIYKIGVRPSKADYEAYVSKHGGPAYVTLVKNGFSLASWAQILEEEVMRTKSAEKPVEDVLSQEAVEEESIEENSIEENPAEDERRLSIEDLLKIAINGIDATMSIGGLEVRVRMEFGSKE